MATAGSAERAAPLASARNEIRHIPLNIALCHPTAARVRAPALLLFGIDRPPLLLRTPDARLQRQSF
jgi:hypothetical protein